MFCLQTATILLSVLFCSGSKPDNRVYHYDHDGLNAITEGHLYMNVSSMKVSGKPYLCDTHSKCDLRLAIMEICVQNLDYAKTTLDKPTERFSGCLHYNYGDPISVNYQWLYHVDITSDQNEFSSNGGIPVQAIYNLTEQSVRLSPNLVHKEGAGRRPPNGLSWYDLALLHRDDQNVTLRWQVVDFDDKRGPDSPDDQMNVIYSGETIFVAKDLNKIKSVVINEEPGCHDFDYKQRAPWVAPVTIQKQKDDWLKNSCNVSFHISFELSYLRMEHFNYDQISIQAQFTREPSERKIRFDILNVCESPNLDNKGPDGNTVDSCADVTSVTANSSYDSTTNTMSIVPIGIDLLRPILFYLAPQSHRWLLIKLKATNLETKTQIGPYNFLLESGAGTPDRPSQTYNSSDNYMYKGDLTVTIVLKDSCINAEQPNKEEKYRPVNEYREGDSVYLKVDINRLQFVQGPSSEAKVPFCYDNDKYKPCVLGVRVDNLFIGKSYSSYNKRYSFEQADGNVFVHKSAQGDDLSQCYTRHKFALVGEKTSQIVEKFQTDKLQDESITVVWQIEPTNTFEDYKAPFAPALPGGEHNSIYTCCEESDPPRPCCRYFTTTHLNKANGYEVHQTGIYYRNTQRVRFWTNPDSDHERWLMPLVSWEIRFKLIAQSLEEETKVQVVATTTRHAITITKEERKNIETEIQQKQLESRGIGYRFVEEIPGMSYLPYYDGYCLEDFHKNGADQTKVQMNLFYMIFIYSFVMINRNF